MAAPAILGGYSSREPFTTSRSTDGRDPRAAAAGPAARPDGCRDCPAGKAPATNPGSPATAAVAPSTRPNRAAARPRRATTSGCADARRTPAAREYGRAPGATARAPDRGRAARRPIGIREEKLVDGSSRSLLTKVRCQSATPGRPPGQARINLNSHGPLSAPALIGSRALRHAAIASTTTCCERSCEANSNKASLPLVKEQPSALSNQMRRTARQQCFDIQTAWQGAVGTAADAQAAGDKGVGDCGVAGFQ